MTIYIKEFISPENHFKRLWDELSWEQRSDAPRREYWTNTLNRSYTYGHGAGIRTYLPQETHPIIEYITEKLKDELGFVYEGCFLNGYESERNSLGWHADDDSGIDHLFPISVVSLYGDGPKNGFRAIQTKMIGYPDVTEYMLDDGSLFIMDAGMQHTHMHRIPKAGYKTKPRISLTFRKLK